MLVRYMKVFLTLSFRENNENMFFDAHIFALDVFLGSEFGNPVPSCRWSTILDNASKIQVDIYSVVIDPCKQEFQ